MKKIVLTHHDISIKVLTPESYPTLRYRYIGVSYLGRRGCLKARTHDNGSVIDVLCANDFCNSNGWPQFSGGNAAQTIKRLINEGFEVYEFEDYKGMFSWIAAEDGN